MSYNNNLQVGQVLWLKVRYQKNVVAEVEHPMLIAKIENDYIEVIALDKTFGKMQCLYHSYNYFINSKNPNEKVISEDSYAQFNTKITIELCDELVNCRKTTEKLSVNKLNDVLTEYECYQKENNLDEARIVYMTKNELLKLNSNIKNKVNTK